MVNGQWSTVNGQYGSGHVIVHLSFTNQNIFENCRHFTLTIDH